MTDLLRNKRIDSVLITARRTEAVAILNHFFIIVELVEVAEGFLLETLSSGKLFFEDGKQRKRFP